MCCLSRPQQGAAAAALVLMFSCRYGRLNLHSLQDHHDKTLQALTHAKKAHLHAMQAQSSLKAAQEAQKKNELAQRHKQEVSPSPCALHAGRPSALSESCVLQGAEITIPAFAECSGFSEIP